MTRFILCLALTSCAQLEGPTVQVVTTEGDYSVQVGHTVQLTATTAPTPDTSYVWSSADPAIATIDESGLITGVAPGQTMLSATGTPSGKVGEHVIVVFSAMSADGGSIGPAVPYFTVWSNSPHADVGSEPFTHWNAQGSVPTGCAQCHSSEGFIDFLGGDGSAVGRVDVPGKIESTIGCVTCHDPSATALSAVTFPSGKTVTNLGAEARCMVCHQGRASGLSLAAQIADAGVGDDVESALLGSTNIHYLPAAATLFAGETLAGFQYPGHVYDAKFSHVSQLQTCTQCHDPHSTKVRFEVCSNCHAGVTDGESARNIRQIDSLNQDYDGDGNRTEGIFFEVQGVGAKVLSLMQKSGAERTHRLCYATSYPLWFNDTDGDGACSATEAVAANAFKHWTPRLARASYNYQLSVADTGGFTHNAKYLIQLLTDSTVSLNEGLVTPVDVSRMVRDDPGHFNGASEAARHWDAQGVVPANCSRCHGGKEGFQFFTQFGVGKPVGHVPNGLECETCHDSLTPPVTVAIPPLTFLVGGKTLALPGNDNLCANCHIGRNSKSTVDAAIARGGALAFIDVHYLAAAGTREGSVAKVGYEYDGKTYAGALSHVGGSQCTSCHAPVLSNHTFRIADVFEQRCTTCHADAAGAEGIRLRHLADADGDGNTTEPLRAEIDGMAARLMVAMQTATSRGICYDIATFPYFFKDTNANGACDATELVSSNGFTGYTPALLKAAYNYQLSRKDPGAWAHNFEYVGQLLFDSIEDVSGATPTNVIRP